MSEPIRILMQTTIGAIGDDWNISRYSLLHEHLSSLTDGQGRALCEVTARDRESNANGDDVVLSRLDEANFDELWF